MSGPSQIAQEPIENKRQLVEWFLKGCTPVADLKIGMEHEKPPFYLADNTPTPFSGKNGRAGIEDFMDKMVADKGWQPGTREKGKLIDIAKDNAAWTLEPALQLETGGAPHKNVHDIALETARTIQEAAAVANELGFRMVATGFHPTHRADTLELMEKSRYAVYRDHIARHNIPNGLDIIACTSTVQANLGFSSEQDAVDKIRASLNAAPAVIAMFATSPFADGKPTGFDSYRSHILEKGWDGRYGFLLPVAFEEGFGFERYTDFVLEKMPMIGFYEGHTFKPAYLSKFADFMEAKLEITEGRTATLGDWSDLLNTVWPDTRPRKFLEMRSADVGPPEMVTALAAFWKGLLYDKTALADTLALTKDWTNGERDYLRMAAPQAGLQTPFRTGTLQDVCKELLNIAEAGLKRQNVLDAKGRDESQYLEPLKEIVTSGLNWSQRLVQQFNGPWKGDISHLFNEMDYARNPSVLKAAPAPQPKRTTNGPKLP